MKEIHKLGCQGDVLFRRVRALPAGAREATPKGGEIVVSHSETGHNHVVADRGARWYESDNPLVCYLQMGDDCAGGLTVEHRRPYDTHEALRLLGLPGDTWEVRRQREWVPEGWRAVMD
jgi:hypothetical protein